MSQYLLEMYKAVGSFLTPALASPFFSALAGAALGVWGAQRVAERATRRKELLQALRQANASIVLAATVANKALTIKKQQIAPLYKKYKEDRQTAISINELLLQGYKPSEPIRVEHNLVTNTPITVPIEALKNLTYSGELMPGRALALVAEVEQALTELTHVIRLHSEQIDKFKKREMSEDLAWRTYFGLRGANGVTDSIYLCCMDAMALYTDDLAFFAAELADDLQAHAARTRKELQKFSKDTPKASTVDFSEARETGLMPPRMNYESWLNGFRTAE